MRKLCLSLLAISFFIIALCGCSNHSKVEILKEFSSKCEVEVNDIDVMLNVISLSGENVAVEIVSPDSMEGLSFERVNSDLYIEYEGLRCITCADYLTSFNPFDILIDSLISVKTTELKFICEEDGCDVYCGRGENGEYNVFVDNKSGEIKKIKPMYESYDYSFIYD